MQVLKGVVEGHREVCPDEDCPTKRWKNVNAAVAASHLSSKAYAMAVHTMDRNEFLASIRALDMLLDVAVDSARYIEDV